jgi:transcriptional regulator with XRE-family HTH domain
VSGRKQSQVLLMTPSALLSARIREARTEQRRSQESLAREVNVSLSTLRKIEKNMIKEPGIFTVLALWRALGLPLTELGVIESSTGWHGPRP